MGFQILTQCPTCGMIPVDSDKARLVIYPDSSSRLSVRCPGCDLKLMHPLETNEHLAAFTKLKRLYSRPPQEFTERINSELKSFCINERDISEFMEDINVYDPEHIFKELPEFGSDDIAI